ncbi:unnamed protein product [Diplocarpon coronariae]
MPGPTRPTAARVAAVTHTVTTPSRSCVDSRNAHNPKALGLTALNSYPSSWDIRRTAAFLGKHQSLPVKPDGKRATPHLPPSRSKSARKVSPSFQTSQGHVSNLHPVGTVRNASEHRPVGNLLWSQQSNRIIRNSSSERS